MKDMKFMKYFIAWLLCLLLLSSCGSDVFDINNDPFKGNTYTNLMNSPISTYLESDSDFTEYVDLLKYADMYNALNQSSAGISFTAFAPTNKAMKAFYRKKGVSSLEELGTDYARSFVLYHTVKDSILPEDFITKASITNLDDDNIAIKIDSINSGEAWLNNEGHVTQMGVSAYNGKIYVLDQAMTPLVETIYDRVKDTGDSKIMQAAIDKAGWKKELSTISDTTISNGVRTINKRYYTFFNVSDETFAKADINSLSDLETKLKANDKQGRDVDILLNQYVSYHIMSNAYTLSKLGEVVGSATTHIWSTEAENQVFTVSADTLSSGCSRYTVNPSGEPAQFVDGKCDILSKNGYFQEVKNWMPVWEPEQSEILWDLADYPEIKNIVPADEYQPSEPAATEQRTRVAKAACFTYEMGEAGSKNNSYSDIDYVNCKSNLNSANNFDRLVFNIGYMGSVEMKTPVIVRGKYKVEITIIYLTSNNFMRQQSDGNGGLMKVSFDDNDSITNYVSPYTQVSSALPGVYTSTLFDAVDFDKTSSHQFKFVVLDPAASTNSNFSLQIDCIRFIPIN
jgi:uncharacterized surface protein with fasciclin (FAS1) repeats